MEHVLEMVFNGHEHCTRCIMVHIFSVFFPRGLLPWQPETNIDWQSTFPDKARHVKFSLRVNIHYYKHADISNHINLFNYT